MISPRVRSKVHPRVLVRVHALQAEDLWPDEKPFTELKSSLINLHLRLDTWETCLACTSDLPSVIWMSSAGKAAYPASSMDSRRLNQPEQIAAVLKVYWTGVGSRLLAGSHKCHKYQKYVYIYFFTYIFIWYIMHVSVHWKHQKDTISTNNLTVSAGAATRTWCAEGTLTDYGNIPIFSNCVMTSCKGLRSYSILSKEATWT